MLSFLLCQFYFLELFAWVFDFVCSLLVFFTFLPCFLRIFFFFTISFIRFSCLPFRRLGDLEKRVLFSKMILAWTVTTCHCEAFNRSPYNLCVDLTPECHSLIQLLNAACNRHMTLFKFSSDNIRIHFFLCVPELSCILIKKSIIKERSLSRVWSQFLKTWCSLNDSECFFRPPS